jgi:hypothetical protein
MNTFIYTVTEYGCNSSPSAMWPPSVRIFTTYSAAYDYYVSVAPSLDEKWEAAERVVRDNKAPDKIGVLEYTCQVGEDGERCCAKRPRGAVIARCVVE